MRRNQKQQTNEYYDNYELIHQINTIGICKIGERNADVLVILVMATEMHLREPVRTTYG
jgi:hypothetical protein